MNDETYTQVEQVIDKLKSLLEIKYVFESKVEREGFSIPMLIVILKKNCSALTQELSFMVAKIVQEQTDFLYRIISYEYTERQLKEGNLFFVHWCTWGKMIVNNLDNKADVFHEYYPNEKVLIKGQFHTLKRHPSKKELYTVNLITDGYLKTFFRISNLFKVHITALEADYSRMVVQEPEHNIREVFGYVPNLIPGVP